ncbi:MAG: DUF6178 family protein, partial [Myxococcota bacterium]
MSHDMSDAPMLRMRPDALGLEPISPTQRMDDLIRRDDARDVVRALEPLELYHLIRAVGRADATELATLASPEQIQTFFDLDCWRRDRFDPARMTRWFETLIELDDNDLQRTMRELDPELPALLFKSHLQVFLLDEEKQAPPELIALQLPWEQSPDGVYAIVYPEDETAGRLMRQLINRLFEVDISLARILLEAARWELISPMEESAYQVRRARLEEMGFIDPYEALALFSWRDPDAAKRRLLDTLTQEAQDDATRDAHARRHAPAPAGWSLPALFQQANPDQSFFLQTMARLAELESEGNLQGSVRDRMYGTVLLTNKAMSALSVEPGDRDATRRSFERVRGTLSIALAYLSDRNLDLAARIMDRAHLQHLFQIGYSLTLKLSRQAEQLLQNPWIDPTLSLIDDAHYSILAEPERLVLTSLLKKRPEYGNTDVGYSEPFTTLHQVEVTATRLSLLAFKLFAVYGLIGLSRDAIATIAYRSTTHPPIEAITLDTLLATAIARAALGQPGELEPLDPHELATLIEDHLQPVVQQLHTLMGDQIPRPMAELAVLDGTSLMTTALNLLARNG